MVVIVWVWAVFCASVCVCVCVCVFVDQQKKCPGTVFVLHGERDNQSRSPWKPQHQGVFRCSPVCTRCSFWRVFESICHPLYGQDSTEPLLSVHFICIVAGVRELGRPGVPEPNFKTSRQPCATKMKAPGKRTSRKEHMVDGCCWHDCSAGHSTSTN